jgi:NitT/TauT family transport system substrate-binding protein
MTPSRRSLLAGAAAAAVSAASRAPAEAGKALRIGTLKFGTVNWLLDTIEHERIGAGEGLAFERLELASTQALTVALQAGEVEMIVSDWLWAMRQRAEGDALLFSPYSSALGAVMVREGAVPSLAALKGRQFGVAGGPLDKSWLLLRAYAIDRIGGDLAAVAEPIYGAPPLLSEQLKIGRLDAVLTFWHFAARLDAAGYQRLVDVADMMRALGAAPQPALVGFVWREALMTRKGDNVAAFFGAVAKANRLLADDDAPWERLRPAMRLESELEFRRLRDYFRAGIPAPWDGARTAAAERLFGILSRMGGTALVGARTRFDPTLFWSAKA